MNQIERENAISAIDGYWMPSPHFTEQNARRAFDSAKEQNRIHRLRDLECIEAITWEQYLAAHVEIAQRLREYAAIHNG